MRPPDTRVRLAPVPDAAGNVPFAKAPIPGRVAHDRNPYHVHHVPLAGSGEQFDYQRGRFKFGLHLHQFPDKGRNRRRPGKAGAVRIGYHGVVYRWRACAVVVFFDAFGVTPGQKNDETTAFGSLPGGSGKLM